MSGAMVLPRRRFNPAWVVSLVLVAVLHAVAWQWFCARHTAPPSIAAPVKDAIAIDMVAPPPAPAPPPTAMVRPPAAQATPAPDPLPVPHKQPLPHTPHKAPQKVVPQRAAPAQPAPAAAPSPPAASPEAVENWQGKLHVRLLQFRAYPPVAEARGEQGVAYVRVSISAQGEVLGLALVKSSGFATLDDDAIAWVRRAVPLPPPPGNMPLTIIVPLRYHIDDDE